MLLTDFYPRNGLNPEPKGGLLSRELKKMILGLVEQEPQQAGQAVQSARLDRPDFAIDMTPQPVPVPLVEGTDEYYLDKVRRGIEGLGADPVNVPASRIMDATGFGGVFDPALLQEFDGLPPEMKREILNEMQTNPFFNLQEMLPPPGQQPFDEFDLNQMQRAGGIQVADASGGLTPELVEQLSRLRESDPEAFAELMSGLGAAQGQQERVELAPISPDQSRAISNPSATQESALVVDDDPNNPLGIRSVLLPSDRREQQERQKVEQTRRMARTVTQDLGIFLEALDDVGPIAGMNNPIGGIIQAGRSNMPRTPENRMRTFMESALANVGFNELQSMRENSPTGGALGNVTERQLEMLQSVLGRWNPTLPVDDQRFLAQRISNIYMGIIAGTPEERAEAVRQGRMSLEEAVSYDDLFYPETRDVMGRRADEEQRQSVLDFLPEDMRPQGNQPLALPPPQQALPAPQSGGSDDDLLRWLEGR